MDSRSSSRAISALVAAAAIALVVALVVACGSDPTATRCLNIPPGGCPLSHGVACEDPSCDATYACNPDGTWSLDTICDHEGGVDASADAVDEIPPLAMHDANIDAPPGSNGGPGCGLLEQPDCALGDALACPAGCCGCEDLFVCRDMGWDHWGVCDDVTGITQDGTSEDAGAGGG